MSYLGPGIMPYWLRAVVCGIVLLTAGAVVLQPALTSNSMALFGIAMILLVPGAALIAFGARARAKKRHNRFETEPERPSE